MVSAKSIERDFRFAPAPHAGRSPARGRMPALSSISRLALPLRVRTRRSSVILAGLRPLRLTKNQMMCIIYFLAQGGVPLNAGVIGLLSFAAFGT